MSCLICNSSQVIWKDWESKTGQISLCADCLLKYMSEEYYSLKVCENCSSMFKPKFEWAKICFKCYKNKSQRVLSTNDDKIKQLNNGVLSSIKKGLSPYHIIIKTA